MMNKHTQAPWKVVITPHETMVSHWHIEIGERNISTFPYKWAKDENGNALGLVKDEEQLANTYLIAAAPDLLNALTVLVEVAEARGIPCDAAQSAIRKARGERHDSRNT